MTRDGPCTLVVDGNHAVMTGPSGRHTLLIDERTDLWSHWRGFLAANGGVKLRFGKIGPKILTNPLSEMDVGSYDSERDWAYHDSEQPVYSGRLHVGTIERRYTQKRGDGQNHPIILDDYAWRSADDLNTDADGGGVVGGAENEGWTAGPGVLASIKRNLKRHMV